MEREAVAVQREGGVMQVQEPAKGDSTWCLTLVAQLPLERAGLRVGCEVRVSERLLWICSQEEALYRLWHSMGLSKLCCAWKCT